MLPFSKNPRLALWLTLFFYFSGLLIWLTPVPFVFLLMRGREKEIKEAILLGLSIVALVYVLLLGPLHPLFDKYPQFTWVLPVPGLGLMDHMPLPFIGLMGCAYFAFYLSISFLCLRLFNHPERWPKEGVIGGLSLWGLGIAAYVLAALAVGESPLGLMSAYYEQGLKTLLEGPQAKNLAPEVASYFRNHSVEVGRLMAMLTPAVLGIGFFSIILVNIVVSQRALFPFKPKVILLKLNETRPSFTMVWVTLFFGFGAMLSGMYGAPDTVFAFFANGLMISAFLYYLVGLAIFSFWMNRRGFFPMVRFFLFLTIFLLLQLTVPIFVILGFVDAWLDIRSRINPPISGAGSEI